MSSKSKPNPDFREGSKPSLFVELAKPNVKGFSRAVGIGEFKGKYAGLQFGNGGDWCRDDGSLGRKYNVRRALESGRIVAVQLNGFKKLPISKPIPGRIRQEVAQKRCAILAVSNVEVDHKDGRRDDPRLNNPDKVMPDDFQPLSKAANNAKRQHCKECRRTNQRFNAKRLGYRVSQIEGNGIYDGTCVGCYWHDPFEFNRVVSGQATES